MVDHGVDLPRQTDPAQRTAVQTAAGDLGLHEPPFACRLVERRIEPFGARLTRVRAAVRLTVVERVEVVADAQHAAVRVAGVVRGARLVGATVEADVADADQRAAVAEAPVRPVGHRVVL